MLQTVTATAKKLPEGMQVETASRNFKILIDEPKHMGGTDAGMNPIEVLLCALGACQSICAASFAKKFGFEFEEFHIELAGDFDPAGFMGDPNIRNGFQEIRFETHFKTNESQEKAEKFADFIEDTCPIADNLTNGVKLVRTGVVRD
ncbi:OsmC family protein [Companilactobacillus zhongbaensis]|uniref:OsmC family protein n=1 Tax=Companilactobacillus zhongbaensis TaxID=2486009 RepID=UPI000F7B94D2|nr:OsmC family protein [Companilactobacillus zhongbaensis]